MLAADSIIAANLVVGRLLNCHQPCCWKTPKLLPILVGGRLLMLLPALLGVVSFHCCQPCWGGLLSLFATDPVVGSLIHCFSGSASSSVLPMLQSDSLLSNFCGGWCHFLRHPVGSKLPWQLVPLNIAAEVALDGLLPQHVVLDCCWILFVQRCLPPLFATRSCYQLLKRLMPLFVFTAMLRPRLVGEPCCCPLCLC